MHINTIRILKANRGLIWFRDDMIYLVTRVIMNQIRHSSTSKLCLVIEWNEELQRPASSYHPKMDDTETDAGS